MEKKNWSNPELRQAEVVDTHATECDCGAVGATFGSNGNNNGNNNKHVCHSTKNHGSNEHNGDENTGRNHWWSQNCPEPSHHIDGDLTKACMCCCYSANSGS